MASEQIMVAVTSRDRPHLLTLTDQFLGQADGMLVCAFDDNSIVNPEVSADLLPNRDVFRWDAELPDNDYRDRAARTAEIRRSIVNQFLGSDCDYLFLKDDDILVSADTIREAVDDFEFLKSTDYASDIGALTLHGLLACREPMIPGRKGQVWRHLGISGEAHVLFSRDALVKAGNGFDPRQKGGFADTQFQALRSAGMNYYDRLWPPYPVQHLGYGPTGSVIHREHVPAWNRAAYTVHYPRQSMGETILVPGFDLGVFDAIALQEGGEVAALKYTLAQGARQ